jgi:DNA segregation ATPase FtsK/SpoIIIE-like protein
MGCNRAVRIIERLEEEGVVSAANTSAVARPGPTAALARFAGTLHRHGRA